jgi:hypothetical protein
MSARHRAGGGAQPPSQATVGRAMLRKEPLKASHLHAPAAIDRRAGIS